MRMEMGWCVLTLVLLCATAVQAQTCTEAQLNTEFLTDPTARGYLTCAPGGDLTATDGTVSDQCVLNFFNQPCTNHASCKTDQAVSREALWAVIDPGELTTLTRSTAANDVARLRAYDTAMLNTTFDMSKAPVRQKLLDIFPGPSSPITNAAIAGLQQKNVPRSQIVCQRVGTANDVSCGLRGIDCP